MGQEIFELNHVSFAYQDTNALQDISLHVNSGEKLCILGANGCGKTTLLRILAGLSIPQKGLFRAFGETVTKNLTDDDRMANAYHKRVGFIFQNADTQLFCTSVKEEIAFGPLQTVLPPEEVKRRVNDVAELLGVEHLLPKAPFHLSGGEKKKVAIAAVLVLNPEVLILDEPTNALDPRSQRWLIQLLNSLSEAGKTIITSTHNLKLAQEVSERSVLFDENHTVAAIAPTKELLQNVELLRRVNLVDESYNGL